MDIILPDNRDITIADNRHYFPENIVTDIIVSDNSHRYDNSTYIY